MEIPLRASMFRSSCVQESSSLTFEPQISNFLPPWKLTYAPAHSPRKYPFGIRAKSGSSEIFSLVLSSTCQGDWIRGVRFSSLENGDWTNLSLSLFPLSGGQIRNHTWVWFRVERIQYFSRTSNISELRQERAKCIWLFMLSKLSEFQVFRNFRNFRAFRI